MSEARLLAANFHKLVCAFRSYFDLLGSRGFAPVDMWHTLSRDMNLYAQIFEDLLALMDGTTDSCHAIKPFDPRTVEWMTNEILEMAEQLEAEAINDAYAANFIRDIEKSHIFTEMFTVFKVDSPEHANRLVRANKTILGHKALLFGIQIPKGNRPTDQEKLANAPKKVSLLASIRATYNEIIPLSHPVYVGDVTIEECLKIRRSAKRFASGPVMIEKVSQLLFAAQGITDPRGYRTAPSMKTAYPLDIIVVAGRIHGLSAGAYVYDCFEHTLRRIASGALNTALGAACHGQDCVLNAPLLIAVTVYTTTSTGMTLDQSLKAGLIEAGHASQNVLLQAYALRMNAVAVGDFNEQEIRKIFHYKPSEWPVYLICCGMRPRDYAG